MARGYTWCSFASDTGFLGLVILRGVYDSGPAATRCRELGLHPGGDMMVLPVPEAAPLELADWKRLEENAHLLLSEGEVKALFEGKLWGALTAVERDNVQANRETAKRLVAADVELEAIERCAFMTFDALDQVATLLGLDPMRRHAAIELLYYTITNTSERQLPAAEKARLVELKRQLIERADRRYTENIGVRTKGVNTQGGDA